MMFCKIGGDIMNDYSQTHNIILSERDRSILSQYALDMSRFEQDEENESTKTMDPYGTLMEVNQ
jgi:hypothetical protein